MTNSILSLLLKVFTSQGFALITDEVLCSLKKSANREMKKNEIKVILQVVMRGRGHLNGEPLFLFEVSRTFGILQHSFWNHTWLINSLAAGLPYNNRLHNSLQDKCIISRSIVVETKSSRSLH